MLDIAEALATAQLPEKTVQVCLRGDLQAEFETLDRKLREELNRPNDSLAGNSTARELAEQVEALRQQMTDHTVTFRMRAIPRRAWTKLVAAHPPRDDNQADRNLGVNEETFTGELIKACTVEPELTAQQWDTLLDERITEHQFQQMFGTAWALNAREVAVPFSHAASTTLRLTAAE